MGAFHLWLPTMGYSVAATAAAKETAFALWRGENLVWLLPWAKTTVRWKDEPGWWYCHLAVPSAHLDRLDIFSVAENEQVAGVNAEKPFPTGCVDGLLNAWLNLEWICPADESWELPWPLTLRAPRFDGLRVTYEDVPVSCEAQVTFPLVGDDVWRSLDAIYQCAKWLAPLTPRGYFGDIV